MPGLCHVYVNPRYVNDSIMSNRKKPIRIPASPTRQLGSLLLYTPGLFIHCNIVALFALSNIVNLSLRACRRRLAWIVQPCPVVEIFRHLPLHYCGAVGANAMTPPSVVSPSKAAPFK